MRHRCKGGVLVGVIGHVRLGRLARLILKLINLLASRLRHLLRRQGGFTATITG